MYWWVWMLFRRRRSWRWIWSLMIVFGVEWRRKWSVIHPNLHQKN
jgi:hypothetical protein